MRRVLRLLWRSEVGMTLAELLTTMLLLGIVVTAILGTLFTVQRAFSRESYRSQSNDQARLAAQELDREIRSGNLLYPPTNNGMNLVIYTQTNASTRNPGNRCVQWQVVSQQLQRRDWSVNWQSDGIVSPWRVVAENVVNQAPPEDPGTPVPMFTLDHSQSAYGDRVMRIVIMANSNAASGRTVRISLSVTGRNTVYGYPQSICSAIPPG